MTDLPSVKHEALTSDELDHVSGGIIIVGGLQRQFTSALERVALNPQPLPPRIFSLGHWSWRPRKTAGRLVLEPPVILSSEESGDGRPSKLVASFSWGVAVECRFLAWNGRRAMSGLSPLCAPKLTSADHSKFMGSRP
jgi:hypothetical protein